MRRPFILSCVAVAVLAALSLWLWRELTRQRDDDAALRAELAALQRSRIPAPPADHAIAVPEEIARVPATTDASAKAPAPAATARAADKPGNATGNDVIRAWQERERQMLRDPAYRDAQREAARQQFAQTRADAIRVVHMTPAEADRVIDLWIERNLWFTEHGDVTGQGRMNEEMRVEMQRRSDAERAEVRDLLGAEKYDDWRHYLETGSERGEVNHLNSQLAIDSAAMSPAVADALVESFYREIERGQREYLDYRKALGAADPYENQGRDDRQHYLELMRAANDRVHDGMAASLNGTQLRKLDAMLAAKLAPIEAQLRLDGR